jgi:hypothetical protein
MSPELKSFLREYQGPSSFVQSLRDQYLYKGYLSEKQVECLKKMMEPRSFSISIGVRLLLSKGASTRISNSLGVDFIHRGFQVMAVHAETERAYLLDVKFAATRTVTCCVCGIQLKNEVSRSIGIGPVCAEKHGIPYELNALNLLQAKLDAVDQTAFKVWVPKHSIKEREEA